MKLCKDNKICRKGYYGSLSYLYNVSGKNKAAALAPE